MRHRGKGCFRRDRKGGGSARARLLLPMVLVLSWLLPAGAGEGAPAPASYRSFQDEMLDLHAWKGSNVAFLTATPDLDTNVMARLVGTFDRVRGFYREATGRDPARARDFEGRVTIAEVAKTCGAACGFLGATGIELTPGVFKELYQGVATRDEIDQALPYEFGRNFWFYSPQLAPKNAGHNHAFITGFAVFMRFPALDAAGAKIGRFRDRDGAEFRRRVEELVDLYEADGGLNFTNTLAKGEAPRNPMGLNGTDLFASFCMRLCRDHGGNDYVKKLWRAVGRRPVAASGQDAIDNFVLAASAAAGRDLSAQFSKQWRWPLSDQAAAEARSRWPAAP